ncbi:MAG: D-alanyl-D-alanine carboxypeptidase [Lachnospiraceae bacterium]|nr:D-alanyl-D-alanine carboxypeptidase [Lachnospiraceae bacterium]
MYFGDHNVINAGRCRHALRWVSGKWNDQYFIRKIRAAWLAVILSASLFMGQVKASAGEPQTIRESDLFSQAAVLMDAATGRVLYGKNENTVLAMASTTKIMTCIIALEYGNPEDTVTFSSYAAAQPKVKLGMSRGKQALLEDLLYSLMLESHNDTAVAIAEHIGTQQLGWDSSQVADHSREESVEAVEAFLKLMNEKAALLGCSNTLYLTPNGLDASLEYEDEDGQIREVFHSTTAAELARVMSYCILESPQKDKFLEITRTSVYGFTDLDSQNYYSCYNHNAFLTMMSGALSGKTGYTGRAGYCYVGALESEGRTFVAALLNCGAYGSQTKKWVDLRRLMEYGIKYYELTQVYTKPAVEPIPVAGAKMEPDQFFDTYQMPVSVAGEESLSLLLAEWEDARVTVEVSEILEAPVASGTVAGTVQVSVDGELYRQFDILTEDDVEAKTERDNILYMVWLFLSGASWQM